MVRVVRRGTTLRAIKKQVRKETTKSRLSRDNKQEYKPRLPPTNDAKIPATVPRAKKRAQLQRLSANSSTTSSGQLSPTMRGMLIGDDTAAFEDSDFVLEVAGLSSNVTVCQSLATLLKEHQREGLQFCWKTVCSQIMNYKQEGKDEIHGSILAHNMGLGKSFQAVCLLHTLLTHPLLTSSSAGIGGSGGRIIHRAMLLAPVNTLANWETEFEKWVGTSSESAAARELTMPVIKREVYYVSNRFRRVCRQLGTDVSWQECIPHSDQDFNIAGVSRAWSD